MVTDSVSDLPAELVARYAITVVPARIHLDGRTYLDGVDLDHEGLYRSMSKGLLPKTSQPSPGQFLEVYRPLVEDGHQVLSIHVTSKGSGTYQSAVLARDMLGESGIQVLDSASLSMGTGFLVLEAVRAIEAGLTLPRILERLHEVRSQLRIYATVGTLKYLIASGRVGQIQGLLGSLLNIKPLVTVEDGAVVAVGRARTRRRALETVLQLVEHALGAGRRIRAAVMHGDVPEEAGRMRDRIEETFACEELFLLLAGVALSANGGPGVIGVVAYPVEAG
ncbi:MAG: DegV family protein [Anaerolineae bacterium]